MLPGWLRSQRNVAVLALPLLAAAPADVAQHFASPDAATLALVAAVKSDDNARLTRIFGAAGMQIVDAGDPVANRTNREKFLAAYNAKHQLDTKNGSAELSIGNDDWRFPIPLRHDASGWSFDVAAGREEILDRRVGANELFIQQAVLAYADAQNEYVQTLHDGLKVHVYAQRLLSNPGKQDGLYWPTEPGQPQSPLGPLVADAQTSGYHPGENVEPQAFHGYFFHILRAQGPHAPGGAYDYVVNGVMLGGYALVAWPAHWGNTGVMTYIINQDGDLYQTDLGPRTAEIARAMMRFDPDQAWQKVGAPTPSAGAAAENNSGG
ncbi:DUF2950 domain-containing protein [Rhodopila sp.]|uniref:DUF2950 domain-containing protein n=1 Tax=Rhodopila sp. TaxID=2480087 RepID=UPI003D0FD874